MIRPRPEDIRLLEACMVAVVNAARVLLRDTASQEDGRASVDLDGLRALRTAVQDHDQAATTMLANELADTRQPRRR